MFQEKERLLREIVLHLKIRMRGGALLLFMDPLLETVEPGLISSLQTPTEVL